MSPTRWNHAYALWSVPDALESRSCHLDHLRRIGLALAPSGLSQTCCNHLHAIPDALDSPSRHLDHLRHVGLAFTLSPTHRTHPHAVWSVPDALDLPSCHLRVQELFQSLFLNHKPCVTRPLQIYITNISLSYRNFIPAYTLQIFTPLQYSAVRPAQTWQYSAVTLHRPCSTR